MGRYYLACFLLLAAASLLLLPDGGRTRKETREKLARYRAPSGVRSSLERWGALNRALLAENRVSRAAYAAMLALCAAGGFFAGRAVFGFPLLAVFVAVFSLAAPTAWFAFRRDRLSLERAEKLNADMMVLSNSYLVTHDVIASVRANLEVLEAPRPFRDFLAYVTYFDSDVESALRRLEAEVGSGYVSQWIDALVMAQKDRSLAYVCVSIVDSMRDSLVAQRESNAALSAVWSEYFTLLALVFSSPLVIRMLLPEAYGLMIRSLLGQAILFLLLLSIVYSIVKAIRINRPLAM